MKSGGRRSIDSKTVKMSIDHEGVYELKLYLRTELGKQTFMNKILNVILKMF